MSGACSSGARVLAGEHVPLGHRGDLQSLHVPTAIQSGAYILRDDGASTARRGMKIVTRAGCQPPATTSGEEPLHGNSPPRLRLLGPGAECRMRTLSTEGGRLPDAVQR